MKRTTLAFLLGSFVGCLAWVILQEIPEAEGDTTGATLNGDVNCDGIRDLSDAITLLDWLFIGDETLCPMADPPHLTARIAELEQELATAQSALTTCQADLAALQASYEECQGELAQTESTLATAQERITELEIPGCTDPEAQNYECRANVDDGSCQYLGCTDPEAENYDPQANVDDGTCRYADDSPGRIRFYTIAELPPLTIHTDTRAKAINNAGQVIGDSFHEVMWDTDGSIISFKSLDGTFPRFIDGYENVAVQGLNDFGQVVGWSKLEDTGPYPVWWDSDGEIHQLEIGAAAWGKAEWINSDRVIVGAIEGPSQPYPVYWDSEGTLAELEVLSVYLQGRVGGINNVGQIVGNCQLSNNWRAVLWDIDGSVTELPLPFGDFVRSEARDINDNGKVAGFTFSSSGNHDIAVIWDTTQNNEIMEIYEPGTSNRAMAINNRDQVVVIWGGSYSLYHNGIHVNLMDLIDEPHDWQSLGPVYINDDSVIVGGGRLNGQQRAFIMRPTDRFYPGN